MPGEKSSGKKRKRESEGVVMEFSQPLEGAYGPILVNYPGVEAPSSVGFRCYTRKRSKGKNDGGEEEAQNANEQDLLVVGESEDMEFVTNTTETDRAADSGCKYLIAIHDRRTSSLKVLRTNKTPHILAPTVKALKSIPISQPTPMQYMEARNALGEIFGTKKAKASIRARERNRVDVSAMEGVIDHLQEGIDKGAVNLMTQDDAQEAADANRLVPPFNATTDDPSEVFPLHGIVPEVEWKALSISAFDEAQTDKDREMLLSHRWSKWLNAHLRQLKEPSSPRTKKSSLKIALYISILLGFRRLFERKRGIDRSHVEEKMPGVPTIILDGLLGRFAETARESNTYVQTSATETKLLTYLFAMCLKLDQYAADTSALAQDLSMNVSKVNQLFKTLGCKIQVLSQQERMRRGLPDTVADVKRAVLTAPVTFPKPKNVNRRRG